MQVIVEPNKGAAISYVNLINHAHTEIRSGTGGRDDLVQDLLTAWKANLPESLVEGQDKWLNFRQFYSAKIKEYDRAGYLKAKVKHANSIEVRPCGRL